MHIKQCKICGVVYKTNTKHSLYCDEHKDTMDRIRRLKINITKRRRSVISWQEELNILESKIERIKNGTKPD